jgi:Cdc6-like AAA superfamily ATPase
MFISTHCEIDSDLVRTPKERKTALQNLLWDVKSKGSLGAITKNTYPQRESLIERMMTKGKRLEASVLQAEFHVVQNQTKVFSKLCPPPGKNPVFIGRKKTLREINKLINDNDNGRFVLLHGIRGTGKKSVVTELCHQYSESSQFSRIFWFNANNRKQLENILIKENRKEIFYNIFHKLIKIVL